MEAQWLAEYPHQGADKRPRKRPRLAWDVAPPLFQPPKVIPMLYCGQELINGNFATAFLPPPPIYYTGPPHNLSPPWRPDDKDGHYVFVVGENLTPRYRILSKIGEGTFGEVLEGLGRMILLATVMHDLRLIHTDLKPENILLVSSESIRVPDYKVTIRPHKDVQHLNTKTTIMWYQQGIIVHQKLSLSPC
ncbi:hypothetical protein GUJ93_ZPchr0001g31724 [Zizania palustris]|uniref:Protein kinase domain-containing protein n=1 Tax=Zizania palustris TaxID=103762 RepID=A0A8J5RZA1_ZIZPA|nr:hypothetical protein GUJ93_ZPchr0001g31724 [Zizania palustris]